jgi:hypothetical protein
LMGSKASPISRPARAIASKSGSITGTVPSQAALSLKAHQIGSKRIKFVPTVSLRSRPYLAKIHTQGSSDRVT